jgi:hypothetical protein
MNQNHAILANLFFFFIPISFNLHSALCMEGYRLQSYQAGAPVLLEEDTDDEAATMEGGRSRRRNRPSIDDPRSRYEEDGHSCYEKPWLRRGIKWLLIVACAALVSLVLFALISSLADDGPASDHGATIPSWARWEVVCLGVGGGLDQSNLPGGFLLRSIGKPAIFFEPCVCGVSCVMCRVSY